jgi:PKD repeat protein
MKKLLSLTIGLMIAAITANAQTCEFTASVSPNGDGNVTYTGPLDYSPNEFTFYWMSSNGFGSQVGYSINYTYNQTTTDNITLLVISNGPDSSVVCNSSQTITVVVDNPNPSCPIVYSNSPGSFNVWTFTSPGANYPATWSFGDGSTASGFEVDHTFENPGTYEVCMNITGGGFTCDNCVFVFVPGDSTTTPSGCSADFFASTSALVGFFIPTGNVYSNNDSYSWDFGDGSTSSDVYPYHNYEVSGTYNVCLTVTSESCFENFCQEVFIPESNVIPGDSSCYAGFIISQDNPYEVSVVNTASGNDLSFTWTISSGLLSISAEGAYPSMTIESTGSYSLCLTVSNANGCYSTFCDSIVVDDNGLIGGRLSSTGFVINVQSPAAITGYSPLALEETTANLEFNAFPNPFNENLTITVNAKEAKAFEIISIDGRLIESGQINNSVNTISTSELGAGIYMLNLIDNNGRRFVQKIVKQ